MTDWKDQLLDNWWAGCAFHTRVTVRVDADISAVALLTRMVADMTGTFEDRTRLRDLIDAELRDGREAYRWVPIAECEELADGEYVVRMDDRAHYGPEDGSAWTDVRAFKDGNFVWPSKHEESEVTHVLSPTLGPIPNP